ncbi:maleylpyruvate isomerase family mycothiol-dependent enzyme [Glycomyces xiaoerkulensis]|uniref:maleylpyruvate isomerase family mycothiol-dependent enzyme n=1 Tax=Glycomyces xiaoerkulensis TaxID=2038139 RepID=UPI000C25E6F7|nr:maleylpyruvate isomerase family mycothiol-dependent enzyme [Glycomyces xiaoerkulensis]
MDTERAEIVNRIDEATKRLVATVEDLSDEQLRAPSALEGWTRGHVITHVARSCDAMCRMLVWARTGEGVPGYPSKESREADIEAGSGRSREELVADLVESAAWLAAEVGSMPQEAWDTTIETPTGATIPAAEIPARRLVEVECHHTDLDTGYTAADWTAGFAEMPLGEPMRTWRADRRAR